MSKTHTLIAIATLVAVTASLAVIPMTQAAGDGSEATTVDQSKKKKRAVRDSHGSHHGE